MARIGRNDKVRLKWVKNKNLDHIIDTETHLKAACTNSSVSPSLFSASCAGIYQSPFPSMIRKCSVLERYPTLFHEFHILLTQACPVFKLTETALMLDSQEEIIHQTHEGDTVERLCRLLMMLRTIIVSLRSLHSLKFDLGLPDNYEKTLVMRYLDHFCFVKACNEDPCLKLVTWRDVFAFSALQKQNERSAVTVEDGSKEDKPH